MGNCWIVTLQRTVSSKRFVVDRMAVGHISASHLAASLSSAAFCCHQQDKKAMLGYLPEAMLFHWIE